MAWGSVVAVHVPVRVLFLSGVLPHSAKIGVLDLQVLVIYWIHPKLVAPGFLPLLQLAVNAEAAHWAPVGEPDPTPARIRLVS